MYGFIDFNDIYVSRVEHKSTKLCVQMIYFG
jgi:hypothetical protein